MRHRRIETKSLLCRPILQGLNTARTDPTGRDYVAPAARIAVFDNDGTLWCEQPAPVQVYFALDRVKALAPQHPEWKTTEPFASLLKGDVKDVLLLDVAPLTLAIETAGGVRCSVSAARAMLLELAAFCADAGKAWTPPRAGASNEVRR